MRSDNFGDISDAYIRAGMENVKRKQCNRSPSRHRHTSLHGLEEKAAIAAMVRRAQADAEHYMPPRQFAKDGRWCVPVSERPAGWRDMGLAEPETAL